MTSPRQAASKQKIVEFVFIDGAFDRFCKP